MAPTRPTTFTVCLTRTTIREFVPPADRACTSGSKSTANAANNTIEGGNGTLNPGGVHGSTVSKPFSLEGYNSGDKPTLYFNYYLDVEGDDDYTLNRQQVDSFRVFATGDDGQWRLVSTNDSFRSFVNLDEYDYFSANGGIPVQELWDDSNVWRQARVDLVAAGRQQERAAAIRFFDRRRHAVSVPFSAADT